MNDGEAQRYTLCYFDEVSPNHNNNKLFSTSPQVCND
jgi:hypothetical protein